MPTTKPRHAITESEAVARALDVASRRWPGEPRARLLTRLIEVGAQQVLRETEGSEARRRGAVAALTDLAHHYPNGYLDDVQLGWPE